MKLIWVITALFTVDGSEYRHYLSEHDLMFGCLQEVAKLEPVEGVEFVCEGHYDNPRYNSQPSWMTHEQAERLKEKFQ